jgi:amino acid transporter
MSGIFRRQGNLLGTFNGVFTPSILTILGVILFLRTGFVVGSVGLWQTLLIILAAHLVSVFTAYSLAALASNMPVKGGGAYYLISRTLGREWGGVIGVILFLAMSVSAAFYALGAAEVMLGWWSVESLPHFAVTGLALLLLVGFALLVWLGTEITVRFQLVVMVLLTLALINFFAGASFDVSLARAAENWKIPDDNLPFWAAFAIFFPAITGFTQGVSMSGVLRNPSHSVIVGTAWAVGLSLVIYLATALALAGGVSGEVLRTDMQAFDQLSLLPGVAAIGLLAAAISSAVASLQATPQLVMALIDDGVFLHREHRLVLRHLRTPRQAVLISVAPAFVTVLAGELNTVAVVVTIAFLLTYGMINLATFYEAHAGSPSFRPTLRHFNKWASLAGVAVCAIAILAIEPAAGLATGLGAAVLYSLIAYRNDTPAHWTDSIAAAHFSRATDLLLRLEARGPLRHPRDWRPQVLVVLPKSREQQQDLMHLGASLGARLGTLTGLEITERRLEPGERRTMESSIREAATEADVPLFALAVGGVSSVAAFGTVLQSQGLGHLRPNTLLFSTAGTLPLSLHSMLVTATQNNISVIAASMRRQAPSRAEAPIDIWWGERKTSELMLLLAYFYAQADSHQSHRQPRPLRLHAQRQHAQHERTERHLREFLVDARISADLQLHDVIDADAIQRESQEAYCSFIPMRASETGGSHITDYLGNPLDAAIYNNTDVLFCLAREEIELRADQDVADESPGDPPSSTR